MSAIFVTFYEAINISKYVFSSELTNHLSVFFISQLAALPQFSGSCLISWSPVESDRK